LLEGAGKRALEYPPMKYFILATLAALALAPAAVSAATPPGTCSIVYGPKAIPNDSQHNAFVVNMDIAPGRIANWHTHPGAEYMAITSGSGWLEIDGQPKVNLQTGHTYAVAPNVSHRAHNGNTTNHLTWTSFYVLNPSSHSHTVLTKGSTAWTPGCVHRI
jgi:quercetin dioxygenase-like cupin family protein